MRTYPFSSLQQQLLIEIYTAITRPRTFRQQVESARTGRAFLPKGPTRTAQVDRSRSLARLEARGLVARYRAPWGVYTHTVALTDTGRAIAIRLTHAQTRQRRGSRLLAG